VTAVDQQALRAAYPPAGNICGRMLVDEPLARHTSWRVGGPADYLYIPADKTDLVGYLRRVPDDEPLMFLGLGSNLLVRDGGIRGTVIGLQGALGEFQVHENRDNGAVIYAEAGVPCAQLARFTAKLGLTGGEFFAGIPGTVGGALAMNAGAFGGETWGQVLQVETIDRHGNLRVRTPADYVIGYRSVSRPDAEWFTAAFLQFERDSSRMAEARIKELLNKRGSTQPIGVYSCGSVFRNPAGDFAARLIEAAGLKGCRIGGATVSEKHANFIVNDGTASALHIEQLIQHVRHSVEEKTGVLLQPEVLIVGEYQ
jgi:UDP-N-acetylmuramate dehydrogenase